MLLELLSSAGQLLGVLVFLGLVWLAEAKAFKEVLRSVLSQ
jgi:hypothetical protein